ncbi:MAG: ferredoxin [Bacteroidetes bacterium]|nr:ferredoxin [Bacteroidota bacterium]
MANLRNKLYICTLIVNQNKIKVMAYKITEDCAACGTCIDECPVGAISEGDIYKIDASTCTDCGSCADCCPVEAIHPE